MRGRRRVTPVILCLSVKQLSLRQVMKGPVKKSLIRIAVLESDPARLVDFSALFHGAQDFELI